MYPKELRAQPLAGGPIKNLETEFVPVNNPNPNPNPNPDIAPAWEA